VCHHLKISLSSALVVCELLGLGAASEVKSESAGELEGLPDEHVVCRQGAQELIKRHIW